MMLPHVHHAVICVWCFETILESEEPVSPQVHNAATEAHMHLCTAKRDAVVWTTVTGGAPTLPIEFMVPALFERKFG